MQSCGKFYFVLSHIEKTDKLFSNSLDESEAESRAETKVKSKVESKVESKFECFF